MTGQELYSLIKNIPMHTENSTLKAKIKKCKNKTNAK
jgi:hypothetical protein